MNLGSRSKQIFLIVEFKNYYKEKILNANEKVCMQKKFAQIVCFPLFVVNI